MPGLDGGLPGGVTLVADGRRPPPSAARCGPASPGLLRLLVGINEAVTTLLLNYVALDLMLFLIYDPWKDPAAAASRPPGRCPVDRAAAAARRAADVHAGILVAVVATVVVWWVLRSTRWGFQLRVVGGNPEAARRAGLPVGAAAARRHARRRRAGRARRARPSSPAPSSSCGPASWPPTATSASWPAGWPGTSPIQVALAAVAAARRIAVGGDSLQIDSGLPAATVNILMALVLLAVFGWTTRREATA